jgi:hypothetical protein
MSSPKKPYHPSDPLEPIPAPSDHQTHHLHEPDWMKKDSEWFEEKVHHASASGAPPTPKPTPKPEPFDGPPPDPGNPSGE